MKIISKFKDFYDYKVAKYGVDEKLVYTRKTYCEYFESFVIDVYTASDDRISEENFNKNLKENFEYFKGINFHKILILGEKLIHLFFTENGVYTHFDAKKLDVSKGTYQSYCSKEITFNDGRNFEITTDFGWDKLFSNKIFFILEILLSFSISIRISIVGFAHIPFIAVLPIWLILIIFWVDNIFFSKLSSSLYHSFQ